MKAGQWIGERGQALLISTFVILILLLSIPVVVFLNQTHAKHQMSSESRHQGQEVAEDGVAYAMQMLSSSTATWNLAMTGVQFPSDCTSGADIEGSDGGHFRITCDKVGTESYQVRVVATAWMPDAQGNSTPIRRVQAFVSQNTLTASLPGLKAPVALELFHPPTIVNSNVSTLNVYWGPILLHDSSTCWSVTGPMDQYRFPRKFSTGGIQGSYFPRSPTPVPPTSDGKEYWAHSHLGFQSVVDTATYVTLAKATQFPAAPVNMAGTAWAASPPGSGYFYTGNGTAIFDSAAGPNPPDPGYSLTSSTSVLFIDGNAVFRHVTFDLHPYGAIIVTGDLTLDENRDQASGFNVSISTPLTHALEDPYELSCGGSCNVTDHWVELSGFIYVKGNVTVNVGAGPCSNAYPGGCNWWALRGALRVDGQLTLMNGNLQLQYDDDVNRRIRMNLLRFQVDSQQDLPPS